MKLSIVKQTLFFNDQKMLVIFLWRLGRYKSLLLPLPLIFVWEFLTSALWQENERKGMKTRKEEGKQTQMTVYN